MGDNGFGVIWETWVTMTIWLAMDAAMDADVVIEMEMVV